jgi:hypothetical protein
MAWGVIDLTTYDGLVDAVKQTLNRRDLDNQVPSFILQAEAKLNRSLRVRDMQTRAQDTTTGEYVPLPTDYLAVYTLEIATPGSTQWSAPLRVLTEQEALELRSANNNVGGTNLVQGYVLYANEIELVPPQTSPLDFRLKYYSKIPSLTSENQSNWLLMKSPDLYLAGACLEASLYLKGDSRLATWNTVRTTIMDDMNIESERARFPQNKLATRRTSFG